MEKKLIGFAILYLALSIVCFSQVDTTYIFNSKMPYGTLDIRIAKSPTQYFYLQEGRTFSFRESSPGVKTNTFRDMTSWDSSPYKEGNLRLKTETGDSFVMNYRYLVPEGYNASLEEGYPIMFILHGFGERGNCEDEGLCYHADRTYSPTENIPPAPTDPELELLNNDHNLLHGGKEHLAAVKKAGGKLPGDPTLDARAFPGFVLFPQNLNGWDQWSIQDAIRLLRLMMKKYNIDEDRVYIQGYSNGGQGLYEAIKRAPWLFTAGIALSAINDASITNLGLEATIAHIPLWIFQGGFDINPYPGKTEGYIKRMRSAGGEVRYTLYPELGHGTWNTAFKEPDFFSWVLGKRKSDIHSFLNSKIICSEQGTLLQLPEGFLAYEWQLNGQTIAGATGPKYFAKTPGTYRARFSRVSNPTASQWNEWSKNLALTVENPPQAKIQQIGTVLLKDLNGSSNAVLQAGSSYAEYYWYKDGNLIDLPGNRDDTLKTVTLTPAFGNGVYTLVVSNFVCKSNPSEPKYVFFKDAAPVNITAPQSLKAVSGSPSDVVLDWEDASENENGFEIWRRRALSDGKFSAWEMATLTSANVVTYTDTALMPQATYQYKIRAVSHTGRSEYTPSGTTENVSVKTILDVQVPEAPLSLKVTPKGVETVLLTWRPSKDNTRIREYYIYMNDDSISTSSTDTTFLLTGLALNKNFKIRVKGVDLSKNFSKASNTVDVTTYFSGLYYEHSTGSWDDLDSIDWSHAEFTGTVREFSLTRKTQDDYYNFRFQGFILIEDPGVYQFRTGSDDGSRLRLDNKLIVNNDGIHEYETVNSANQTLQAGPHKIVVEFFDYIQTDTLVVEYKGPDTGNQWTPVTREVLKSDKSVVTALSPDNGPEDSFMVSVYPNPTTQDNINVKVQTVVNAPVLIRLLDPVGRNLFDGVFQPLEAEQGIMISPAGIASTGIYVVIVTQGNVRIRQKIIIRR